MNESYSYLAGTRSSSVAVPSIPETPRTLTAILTGFLRPTLTSWSTPSVILALNRPVRLCFGSRCNILVKSSLNPMSNKRSASSRTSTSKEDCGQWTCGEDNSSSNLPGVAMRRLGEWIRNWERSCCGVVEEPPRRSCGRTLSDLEEAAAGG